MWLIIWNPVQEAESFKDSKRQYLRQITLLEEQLKDTQTGGEHFALRQKIARLERQVLIINHIYLLFIQFFIFMRICLPWVYSETIRNLNKRNICYSCYLDFIITSIMTVISAPYKQQQNYWIELLDCLTFSESILPHYYWVIG